MNSEKYPLMEADRLLIFGRNFQISTHAVCCGEQFIIEAQIGVNTREEANQLVVSLQETLHKLKEAV